MPGPVVHTGLIQGSDEWHAARCGMLTASEMKLIITPTLKMASNEKERAHLWELAAQRISQYVEPSYVGDAMLRGWDDEIDARNLYTKHIRPVEEIGFITNDRWGFTLGYSPDGRVNPNGGIECKSRKQRFQIETIATNLVPDDFAIQLQTGLLVSEWDWIDFLSFSGGLPMVIIRVYPDQVVQDAILEAADAFEARITKRIAEYEAALGAMPIIIPTERRIEQEMFA